MTTAPATSGTDRDAQGRAARPAWLPEPERLAATVIFAVTIVLILAPIAYLVFGSFRTDSPGAPDARFTFANWIHVYTSPDYQAAFVNTVALSAVVAFGSVLIGGILAWIIVQTDAPWRRQLAVLMVVPLMISNLITALAWIALAAPNAGFINAAARAVGIGSLLDIYSFGGIALVLILHYASFAFIAVYAALRSVDASLEEASYILGAGPFTTAWKMTLPLILPTLGATFLIIFIFTSENFSVPILLGGPTGFSTIAGQIYVEMTIDPGNPPRAAAAGTMLVWIAIIGMWWQRRVLKRAGRYVTIGGKGGRHMQTALGRWRYAATGVIVFYLILAIGLPYCALVLSSLMKFVTPRINPRLFTLDNFTVLLDARNLLPLRNSVILSVVGGLGIAFLYMVIAYLIRRSRGWLREVIDYSVLIPTVIPALVLGVGLVWTFVGLPLPIYGTIAILFIAYFVRFVGQGVQQSRAALVQVSDELNEAARVVGAGPWRAFRDIVMPLLRPALVSLWTVLFIFIFMEISVTVMLYAADTATLPILLWENMHRGYQTRAFAVAVVQATIIFLLLYAADRLFGTLRTTLER